MSYETCESCGKSGETDNDEGGLWYRVCYTCAACVKAQIAAEDPSGDAFEERQIREREHHDDRPDDKAEKGSWSNWRNVTDRTDGK